MIKYILILFLTLSLSARENSEKYYQDIIAEKLSGKTEHVLEDKTRVDILTKSEAIEVMTELSDLFDDIEFDNKEIKLIIGDLCTSRDIIHRDLNNFNCISRD